MVSVCNNEMKQNKINTKNTPYLIIVESPSKCKKIEKILGFQYKCIASNGHFREISKINTTKNNNGKKYEPVFEIIASKKKHVENMREMIDAKKSGKIRTMGQKAKEKADKLFLINNNILRIENVVEESLK